MRAAAFAVVVGAARVAAADPVASSEHSTEPEPREPSTEPKPRAEPDHTAADVDGQPRPGDESGRIDPAQPGDSGVRKLARAALWLPKMVVETALAPMRGAVWANDRYDLEARYYELLYNRDRTIGFDPVASYQSGFGSVVGARFNDLDLAGDHEQLSLQAAWGGQDHQSHALSLRSGDRFGSHLRASLDGNFDRRPSDAFFGYGNVEEATPTFHRYGELRAALTTEVRATGPVSVVAHGAIAQVTIDDSPARHGYGELELRWDDRRAASYWEPRGIHGAGTLASVFAGRVMRIDDQPSFWHYGAELQHYFRLASGPRVLVVRARGEGITGELPGVPFEEVPALGGDTFLRGYSYGRFRDRVAAFGSVQYMWDLSRYFDAYLFSDAGRVYPSVDDLSLDHMRVGYGLGLVMHAVDGAFLIDGNVASSIDGGIVLNLSFNPVLDARPRWR